MHKFCCWLFFCFLGISFGITAQASEGTGYSYVDKVIAEKNEAQKEYIGEIDALMKKRMLEQDGKTNGIVNYNLSEVYQVYMMEPLFLTIYNETGSFTSTISDTVQWKLPIKLRSGDDGLAVFSEGDRGLTFAGTVVGEASNTWMVNDEEIKTSVVQSKQLRSEIEKLQIVHSYMYQTTFVYLQNKDGEYLVPYSYFADEIGIQNGKAYTVSELMKSFNKCFDEEQMVEHPNHNVGIPFRQKQQVVWIVCVVGMLVVGIVGWMLYYAKKKKNQSN